MQKISAFAFEDAAFARTTEQCDHQQDDDSADVLGQLPNVTVQEVPQPLLDLFFRIKE